MTQPPPPAPRVKARRRRRQVPALVAVAAVMAVVAVAGGIVLWQVLADDPLTTSAAPPATTDPRSGLEVGHQVSSLNGVDVPLPEGFRLEYEAHYPHQDIGLLIAHHEEIAHRAQVFTFLEPGAFPDAAAACTEQINTLAPQLGGAVDVGEVQPMKASGEVDVARCTASGENLDLGVFHYQYLAYTLPDGRTILQQTRLPGLQVEINAERHEVYRTYFTCVIDDHFDVGMAECG